MEMPQRLRTPDAARYCGLRPQTLHNLRCRGGGPAYYRLGNVVIYDRTDLDAWMSARKYAHTGCRLAPTNV